MGSSPISKKVIGTMVFGFVVGLFSRNMMLSLMSLILSFIAQGLWFITNGMMWCGISLIMVYVGVIFIFYMFSIRSMEFTRSLWIVAIAIPMLHSSYTYTYYQYNCTTSGSPVSAMWVFAPYDVLVLGLVLIVALVISIRNAPQYNISSNSDPLLTYSIISFVFVTALLAISKVLYTPRNVIDKVDEYECGFRTYRLSNSISTGIYKLGFLFILMDLEVSVLIPLSIHVNYICSLDLMLPMGFVLILVIGLIVEYIYGGLDWFHHADQDAYPTLPSQSMLVKPITASRGYSSASQSINYTYISYDQNHTTYVHPDVTHISSTTPHDTYSIQGLQHNDHIHSPTILYTETRHYPISSAEAELTGCKPSYHAMLLILVTMLLGCCPCTSCYTLLPYSNHSTYKVYSLTVTLAALLNLLISAYHTPYLHISPSYTTHYLQSLHTNLPTARNV